MIERWKAVFNEHSPRLAPNRKTTAQVLSYLARKYPVAEKENLELKQAVVANVLQNDCHKSKLQGGKKPCARVFYVENTGAGRALYQNQDEVFKGSPIWVGLEFESGFFMVEGSSELWDDLCSFRGLDAEDLTNYYLVAEYVSCLEKSRRRESENKSDE